MINFIEIISLAIVDAINPCALAVMAIVLMTILMSNPEKRKNVLLGGLAFISAVYLCYFFYGLIMIQFFSYLIPETGKYSYYLFKGFGAFAIILGYLNIKDYLDYKPGGVMTEMPLSMRPKMKLLVKKITNPKGAFIIGIFVTLFLLPCTIGPYIIASGKLSVMKFFSTIPWLLLYNLIFVIPMILITLIIYFSFTTVEKISSWKDKNIKKLHFVEGIILIILGIAMITGMI
ncbi:MAG: hypothetical protein KJ559_02250 [Nanoarchaeota archaeon]|nr:hypothetical protein [Nanoarchaeota archaeon]